MQAPSTQAVAALFEDPRIGDETHDVEIYDWEFGGRR
jgi:hypothetical protein